MTAIDEDERGLSGKCGDVVLADASGVLVLPRAQALAAAEKALAIQQRSVERGALGCIALSPRR